MMYGGISTMTVALHKTKKKTLASKCTQADDHKDTHTKKTKQSIQVFFNIQSLDEACCLGRGMLSNLLPSPQ